MQALPLPTNQATCMHMYGPKETAQNSDVYSEYSTDTTVTHLRTTPGHGHCTILHATCCIMATYMYMYRHMVHVACCNWLMVKSDTSNFCHDSIQPTIDRLPSHSSTSECTFKSTCSTLDAKNCRLCTCYTENGCHE